MEPDGPSLVRSMFEAMNSDRPEDAIELFEEDATLLQGPMPDSAGEHSGHQAIAASVATFIESWSEIHFEPVEIIEGATGVFVDVHITGRGRGSGLELSNHYFHAYRLDGGKIARCEVYTEPGPALAAAGASR